MVDPHYRDLEWIHRCNQILLVLMAFLGLGLGKMEVFSGLMAGGSISLLNFRLMVRIISRATEPGASKPFLAMRIALKFLGLMLAITGVLFWAPVDYFAFVIGISLTFISLGLSGLVHLFRRQASKPESIDA